MEVLGLVGHLKQEKLCAESYQLFLTIMATAGTDRWLWDFAELSLIGSFQWGITRPHVGDPATLVRFLEHCLLEQKKGTVVDGPVERIMLALAGSPAKDISDGIARVDFTRPLFFNGICNALRDGAPSPLRRATVAFLRHLDTQFFNSSKTFSTEQIDSLISAWSSSAQELWGEERTAFPTEGLVATFMGLLDSPLWREHIPGDQWKILAFIGGTLIGWIDEECIPPSFYRCVKNSTIIPYLERADPRGTDVLAQWAAILWAKYPYLSTDVKQQVKKVTKDRKLKHHVSTYQTIVEEQIQQIQDSLKSYASPFGTDVEELRRRLDSFRAAREVLAVQKTPQ
jgi:hypothetical protein